MDEILSEVEVEPAHTIGVRNASEDRLQAIGGLHVRFSKDFSAIILFDWVHVHPTLTFAHDRHVLSLLLIRGKHPGLSYSVAF